MPCNSIRIWLNPDEVPEISGPDELAHLLISYRQMVDENLRSDLSEEVVRRVVSAAFSASLIQDEGRYPRFRLFVSSFEALTDPLVATQETGSFYKTDGFEAAILRAANLGDDADTTAAICAQLAGSYYGESGIPKKWLEKLAMRREITESADRLFEAHRL